MIVIRLTKFGRQGFSLLELVVVTVLISIIVAVSFPAIGEIFLNDPLKKSARLITATIHQARQQALGSSSAVALMVDGDAGTLTILSGPRGQNPLDWDPAQLNNIKLSGPVAISSLWSLSNGQSVGGTMPVWINERGMIEPVIISLRAGDRVLSLRGEPFSAGLKISDRELVAPEYFGDGTPPIP